MLKSYWTFWNNKNDLGPITFMDFYLDIRDGFQGVWDRKVNSFIIVLNFVSEV